MTDLLCARKFLSTLFICLDQYFSEQVNQFLGGLWCGFRWFVVCFVVFSATRYKRPCIRKSYGTDNACDYRFDL